MSGQTNGGVFNPRNLNMFGYTYNNPVNLVDPDGNNPGPVYIKGPLAQIDLQSGNSIVDNTVLGTVNTIFNFSNSVVNSGLNALTAIDNAVSPYEGAMYSAVMGGAPQLRPAAVAGYVGIKTAQAGGKLSSAIHTLSRGSKSLPNANFAKVSGQMRDILKGQGNFGIGSGTRAEAKKLGETWVGEGFRVSSNGKALISSDGLRQYRAPSVKPRRGGTQANFEQRSAPNGKWEHNAHMDIKD